VTDDDAQTENTLVPEEETPFQTIDISTETVSEEMSQEQAPEQSLEPEIQIAYIFFSFIFVLDGDRFSKFYWNGLLYEGFFYPKKGCFITLSCCW
jgi:hypothetical protein